MKKYTCSKASLAKAVFLDRDGTLIRDMHYLFDPHAIELLDGVGDGLRLLQALGYKLIVVSNQSAVARGLASEDDVDKVNEALRSALEEQGIALDGIYYCPHHPEGTVSEYAFDCNCRKPRPGMLLRGAKEHHIDLLNSWMMGDIWSDVMAGFGAGCRSVLIQHSYMPEEYCQVEPTATVGDFLSACRVVLTSDK